MTNSTPYFLAILPIDKIEKLWYNKYLYFEVKNAYFGGGHFFHIFRPPTPKMGSPLKIVFLGLPTNFSESLSSFIYLFTSLFYFPLIYNILYIQKYIYLSFNVHFISLYKNSNRNYFFIYL